jgi:hypothetical protein
MSETNTIEQGEPVAAEQVAEGTQPSPITPAEAEPAKRTVRRKPLWLLVPGKYHDDVDDAGEIVRKPAHYELYECATEKEVTTILNALGLDIATLAPGDVKIFRADPVPLKMSTQVTIKFR